MSQPAPKAIPVARLVKDGRGAQAAPQPPFAPSKPNAIEVYIALEIEARKCVDLDSLRFSIVNSLSKIAPFEKAFLAEPKTGGGWQITCASSVHKIDNNAPLIRFVGCWLDKAVDVAGVNSREPRFSNFQQDARQFEIDGEAPDFAHAFWLPIKNRRGETLAALLALKEQPWRPQMVSLLIPLAGAYGHAWEALQPQVKTAAHRILGGISKSRLMLSAAALVVAAAFIPVPMSCLAPAEIVARQPTLVTAPIDGVVADILQPPGTMIEKDSPLVAFSDVTLRNNWEIAKHNKNVAQAKYFKVVQKATSVQKEVEDIAVAKAELDVAASELAYAEEVLARTVIKADRAGLVVYASKSDWIGRPVKTGERIMEIADPENVELKIDIAASDAITVNEGGRVALFLDGDPLTAIRAGITRTSYRPAPNGENGLVYRVHAAFDDGKARRIGLRGVARVSAGDVPLGFYLFRRPIAALRQRVGL